MRSENGALFCFPRRGVAREQKEWVMGKYPGYNGVKEVPTKIMPDFVCRYVSGTPRGSEENTESMFVPKEDALQYLKAPAIIQRCKAFPDDNGRPTYMEYRTVPEFELRLQCRV